MWDQDQFKAALDFAAKAHGPQAVPGSGFPYVVHVVKVATEVLQACTLEPGHDVGLAMVVALLHDTVEDCGTPRDDLKRAFGDRVARGVLALSKDDRLAKGERMADSLQRIGWESPEIAMVKLADRITNLEPPPPHWPPEKRRAYLAEAGVIHSALGKASPYLAARLAQKMDAYRAFC